MGGGALSVRQRRIFACLVDTIVAPADPLPAVEETDVVAAFEQWLARFPAAARVGFRALLVALEVTPRLTHGRPWHALDPASRLRVLDRCERTSRAGPALVGALRAAAGAGYYGDRYAASVVGYRRTEAR